MIKPHKPMNTHDKLIGIYIAAVLLFLLAILLSAWYVKYKRGLKTDYQKWEQESNDRIRKSSNDEEI